MPYDVQHEFPTPDHLSTVTLPTRPQSMLRSLDFTECGPTSDADSLRSISPGLTYLIDSPVREALVRNAPVFAALGFRIRPEYQDARLEVLEFVRLNDPVERPIWIRSLRDERQALVVGTLRIDLSAQVPLSAADQRLRELGLMDRPCNSGFIIASIEWLPSELWLNLLPAALHQRALQVTAAHSQELTDALQSAKEEKRTVHPAQLRELIEHGLITDQQRADWLNGLRDVGRIVSFREPEGSSRTTKPTEVAPPSVPASDPAAPPAARASPPSDTTTVDDQPLNIESFRI